MLFSKSQQIQQPRQSTINILKIPLDIRRKIVGEQDLQRAKFLNKILDKNEKEIKKILEKIDEYEIDLEKYKAASLPPDIYKYDVDIGMLKHYIRKEEKLLNKLYDDTDKYAEELDNIEIRLRMRAELVPWPQKPPTPLRSYYLTRSRAQKPYYNTRLQTIASQTRASQSRASQSRASQSRASQSRSTQIKKTIKKTNKKKTKKKKKKTYKKQ